MADYFTQFSAEFPMPTIQAAEHLARLLLERSGHSTDALEEDYRDLCSVHQESVDSDGYLGYVPEVEVRTTHDTITGITAHRVFVWDTDGNPDLEVVVGAVRLTMARFNLDGPFVLEWADTCSKPRTDGFGGGAAVLYKDQTRWLSTGSWVGNTITELTSGAPS